MTPELLSGDEEAALSFLGATADLDAPAPYLVVDIGGGSTEFVLGTDAPVGLVSLDMGCVRITEQFLHSDPPAPEELSNAVAVVRDLVAEVPRVIPGVARRGDARRPRGHGHARSPRSSWGSPSTTPKQIHHFRLTRAAAEDVFRTLATETAAQRAHNPGLEPGRVDVIVGGAAVLVGRLPRARIRRDAGQRGRHPRRSGAQPGRSGARRRDPETRSSQGIARWEPGNPPTRGSFVPRMRVMDLDGVQRRPPPAHGGRHPLRREVARQRHRGRRSRRVAGDDRDRPRAPSLAPHAPRGARRVGRRAGGAARRRSRTTSSSPTSTSRTWRARRRRSRGAWSPATTSPPRCTSCCSTGSPSSSAPDRTAARAAGRVGSADAHHRPSAARSRTVEPVPGGGRRARPPDARAHGSRVPRDHGRDDGAPAHRLPHRPTR